MEPDCCVAKRPKSSRYCEKADRKMKKLCQLNSSSFKAINLNRKTLILGAILVTMALFLLYPSSISNQLVEGKKAKKAIKSIVKGLILQNLSTRKNFLPLPVPIPVPIEINDPPVYIKAKPKYVNIYKQTKLKPTPQPIVKPTTVYHMPVYSPTYGYMSMDPLSMYGHIGGGHMMYSGNAGVYGTGYNSLKSSIHSDSDSTSAMAGINFNDYDDEFGNYYVRKSSGIAAAAAKRRQGFVPTATNEDYGNANEHHRSDRGAEVGQSQLDVIESNHGSEDATILTEGISDTLLLPSDNEEQLDHVDYGHKRSKRQVYYQSGYNGEQQCEGFPLEINVKSRIKMDKIFPIFGRSQLKKCVKKIQLLPPVEDHPRPHPYK